jgi:hypothetical protein
MRVPDWVRLALRRIDYGPSDTCWTVGGAADIRPFATGPDGDDLPMARVIWLIFYGAIDARAEIHHRCRHPWCVNPDHLEMLAAVDHHRAHRPAIPESCVHGHRLDKANLAVYPIPDTDRIKWACKQCNRERMRRLAASRKAEAERIGGTYDAKNNRVIPP